jgi:hypothetical protein
VGVLSGVLGGLVLDGVMRVLSIHTSDGSTISMIGYLGLPSFRRIPGSAGWHISCMER